MTIYMEKNLVWKTYHINNYQYILLISINNLFQVSSVIPVYFLAGKHRTVRLLFDPSLTSKVTLITDIFNSFIFKTRRVSTWDKINMEYVYK